MNVAVLERGNFLDMPNGGDNAKMEALVKSYYRLVQAALLELAG